ncbi:MAG: ABC transporter permease [Acidimicrobiia bacterium]
MPSSAGEKPAAEWYRRLWGGGRHWLLLSPVLVVVAPLFAAAVVLALLQSFDYFPLIGRRSFSFDAYGSLLVDGEFWRSLLLSLWIGVAAAVLSVALGICAALAIRRAWGGSRWLAFLFQINLPVPHVIGALAMIHLLSQSGWLARLTHASGLIDTASQFPILTNDPWALGIIAEFVWKDAPFIGIITLGVLGSLTESYEDVAGSLGASGWQRLRHVTLPMLMPALAPASVIVFAFAFGSFEVPLLLGGTFPSALPVLAYRLHTNVDLAARPEGMALAVIMSLVVMTAAVGYLRLVRRYLPREAR